MPDTPPDRACLHAYVSGRVQGVFFRQSTRRRALELGLGGHAHNLPDGRVEVLACGPREALRALEDWLWLGPPHAEVAAVEVEYAAFRAQDEFLTG
jgi:acylphosphatase